VQVLTWIHLVFGFALALGALGLAILAWGRRRAGSLPAAYFRGASHWERLLVLQAAIGVVLYLTHHRAQDPLHYIYGGILLLGALVEQGLRPERTLREAWAADYGRFNEPVVYAVLMGILFLAAGRGIMTGLLGY
jgi:hypothetical protein